MPRSPSSSRSALLVSSVACLALAAGIWGLACGSGSGGGTTGGSVDAAGFGSDGGAVPAGTNDGGGTSGGADGGAGGACLAPTAQGACTANPGFPLTCGANACCPTASPYYCGATNSCHPSAAAAAAACGTAACTACVTPTHPIDGGTPPTDGGSGTSDGGGGHDGGVAACTAPPTSPDPACNAQFPVDCGGGFCCPAGLPFYCQKSNQCYTTLAAAQADPACQGGGCMQCTTFHGTDGGTDGGVACTAPPTSPDPSCNAQFPVDCGGGFCCPAGLPFYCQKSNQCYSTLAAAEADPACRGGGCMQCTTFGADGGTDGGAAACAPAPASNSCTSPQFPVDCGGGTCCPPGLPFYCPQSNQCYSTQAGAQGDPACRSSGCQACRSP